MTDPYLSVVVPVYNEADNLEPLHREIADALEHVSGGAEIIYVDDGSVDASPERLAELAKRDGRVRVVRLVRNSGQSAAMAAGFEAARGAVTACMDSDLQNDPADIPKLLAALDPPDEAPGGERFDVVNGVRADRQDTVVRKLSSKIGNGFRNRMTRESVTDVGCSLRVMRTEYLKRIKMYRGLHRFLPTLLRLEGARVTELPVHHRPRRHGESKYGIGNRLFVGLADVFAVRWMQSRQLRYEAHEQQDGSPR